LAPEPQPSIFGKGDLRGEKPFCFMVSIIGKGGFKGGKAIWLQTTKGAFKGGRPLLLNSLALEPQPTIIWEGGY